MEFSPKSPNSLVGEYRELVASQAPLALMLVNGAAWGVTKRGELAENETQADISWILAAHKGTLEKLPLLLPHDRLPSSLELIAAARNLFENLVWTKLFQLDPKWGEHFYGRFLKDQLDDLNGLTAKIMAEIELFKIFDEEDSAATDQWIADLDSGSESRPDHIKSARDKHDERLVEIDRRARRTFSLYATQAVFNGYGFQVHLLESTELPRIQSELANIQARVDAFKSEVNDEAKIDRYFRNFNWAHAANLVGMMPQYEYLYRLTSRLLHSGPMNILTEKELSESEQMILLEYMVVAAMDIFELIEAFDFPGRLRVAMIELESK